MKDSVSMIRRLGILGGGQLGKMLCEASKKMDSDIIISVYDASDQACARSVCDSFTCGAFDDVEKVRRFAQDCDIITYEFENISPMVVRSLDNAVQGSEALRILQNRSFEKEFIDSLKLVTCVPHKNVSAGFSFDYPFIVKTDTLGYDGKGQYVIQGKEDLHHVKRGMIAEQYLTDMKEYSMIIARNVNGQITHYPPFENVHVNQILDTTTFARIDRQYERQMFETSALIAEKLDYYGVLAVEFFLSGETLYVNEAAPRVHNSGHITLDAANISQFTLHLYSLLGKDFPSITVDREWCSINVLGQHYENVLHSKISGKFYDYGKKSTKKDRKVGHINGALSDMNRLKEARIR